MQVSRGITRLGVKDLLIRSASCLASGIAHSYFPQTEHAFTFYCLVGIDCLSYLTVLDYFLLLRFCSSKVAYLWRRHLFMGPMSFELTISQMRSFMLKIDFSRQRGVLKEASAKAQGQFSGLFSAAGARVGMRTRKFNIAPRAVRGHVHMTSTLRGEGGWAKRRCSKGGCANYILQNSEKGGRGSKNPKILRTSYVHVP